MRKWTKKSYGRTDFKFVKNLSSECWKKKKKKKEVRNRFQMTFQFKNLLDFYFYFLFESLLPKCLASSYFVNVWNFFIIALLSLLPCTSHLFPNTFFLMTRQWGKLNKTIDEIADEGMVVIDYGLWRYHPRKSKKEKGCVERRE